MDSMLGPIALAFATLNFGVACNAPAGTTPGANMADASEAGDSPASDAVSDVTKTDLADVVQVSASGPAGQYTFSVSVASPDTGCDKYADYWEVLSEQGELLYRRILAHSHVGEQPFTRTGGPVPVQAADTVIVRAHMRPGGYGGTSYRGSVDGGFATASLDPGFALDVESLEPQPGACAF